MVIGIGIGMIITSIINLLFWQEPMNSASNIDEDPFITIVQNEKNYDKSEGIDSTRTEQKNSTENIHLFDNEENNKGNQEEYNGIYISKGMNSEEIAELLMDEKIISSSEAFIEMANKLGVIHRLRYGQKKIPVDSSLEDILKILVEIP